MTETAGCNPVPPSLPNGAHSGGNSDFFFSAGLQALGVVPAAPVPADPAPSYCFCKLVPPRAAFPQSMTSAERSIMGKRL